MSTPTPAQALGECLKLMRNRGECGSFGYVDDNLRFTRACIALVEQHGQHFAGLESDLSKAYELAASHADRADDAEAALKVVREEYQVMTQRWVSASDRCEAAEARVREAEGLLRDARDSIIKATMVAAGYVPEPEPGTIMWRLAAFLAASGETK